MAAQKIKSSVLLEAAQVTILSSNLSHKDGSLFSIGRQISLMVFFKIGIFFSESVSLFDFLVQFHELKSLFFFFFCFCWGHFNNLYSIITIIAELSQYI